MSTQQVSSESSFDPTIQVDRARELRAALVALGPRLFNVEDFTLELPLRQLRACWALYTQSRTMSELGREIGVSLSAMTQVADRLERAGLVERSVRENDRRIRLLQLTAKGRRLMREHDEVQLGRIVECLDRLRDEQVGTILESLHKLLQAAKQTATPHAEVG
jgi:DNA-binding MarR family transcriptional regulator